MKSNTLNRQSMNQEAIAKLEQITSADPSAMTNSDKEFLRARRMYLTPVEEEKFAEALEVPEVDEVAEEVVAEPFDGQSDPFVEQAEEPTQPVDLEAMDLDQLKEFAKTVGVKSPHLYGDADKLRNEIKKSL